MIKKIRIKICGMKDPGNIEEVAALRPHFMGFILYKDSPRYISFGDAEKYLKKIPGNIQKVGVLVNEPYESAVKIAESGAFDLLQLHGNESVDYCRRMSAYIKIIKAFPITNSFPVNMPDYQPWCSFFMFDTSGDKPGGTGKKFNHNILSSYSSDTEYFLSGGISADDHSYIKSLGFDKMTAVDINSKFEMKPGIKNIELLRKFIEKIRENDEND